MEEFQELQQLQPSQGSQVARYRPQSLFGFKANLSNSARSHSLSVPSTSRPLATSPTETGNDCFTAWNTITFKQEWTIHHIKKALELSTPGLCMKSKPFKDENISDINWQLCLYPGGKREENKGNVSLFLKMSTTDPKDYTVRAQYCFYFIDDVGHLQFNNVNTGDFKVKPSKGSHSWGLRNIPRHKVLKSVRNDGSLHILCQIETVPDFNKIQTSILPSEPSIISQNTDDYLKRIHNMMKSGIGSDFVVECDGQHFPVHKFILMAQSSVFRAMFQHENLREIQENKLVVADSDPQAVHQMLNYMYSGSLPDEFQDEHAPSLMQLAEKYDLGSLKLLCEEKLISRVSANNVCFMLDVADTHRADQLLQACIPVIKLNSRTVINSSEWAEMKSCNHQLINSVLEQIVVSMDEPPPIKRLKLQHHSSSSHFAR